METLERCCRCDDPTGHAGRGDDSLYTDDGKGPFCNDCYHLLTDLPEPPWPQGVI